MKIVAFAYEPLSDIVPAFGYFLHRNWPDCPHELIYVVNGKKELKVEDPVYHIGGPNSHFGWRVKQFVQQHCEDDEPILIILADCLVLSVNPRVVARAEELMRGGEVVHVRLRPKPPPQLPYDDDFGRIRLGTRYSLSFQPGIWRAKTIHNLCRNDEDPGATEIQGSRRTRTVGDKALLCAKVEAIEFVNYYNHGRPWGSRWLRLNAPEKYWTDAARRAKTGRDNPRR